MAVPDGGSRYQAVVNPTVVPTSFVLMYSGTEVWQLKESCSLPHRVVFLKDTWRFRGIEGETLCKLHDVGVRNIPLLLWHGDVPDLIPECERTIGRE